MRALGIALFLFFKDAVEFLGRSFDLTLPVDGLGLVGLSMRRRLL